MPNASSKAMTSSTVSRESAPRSSTKEASGFTSSAWTPSCSTMMPLTFSSTEFAICNPPKILSSLSLLLVVCRDRHSEGCRDSNSSVRSLSDVKPAAHVETGARHVGGRVGRQIEHRPRDVVRGSQPSEHDLAHKGLLLVFVQEVRHGRLDVARRDGVDGDSP